MSEENAGSTWEPRNELATGSGTVGSDNTVSGFHGSANIASVVADHAAGTLVVHFAAPFDPNDNVYFVVGFVYAAGGLVQPVLPIAFGATSVTLLGAAFPGTAPWTFAILAVTSP